MFKQISRALISSSIALATLSAVGPVSAAETNLLEGFARFNGGMVVGDSQQRGWEGWVEISSVSSAIGRPDPDTGGPAQLGKVGIIKGFDSASIGLRYHALTGSLIDQVEVDYVVNGIPFAVITLERVTVSSIDGSVTSGGQGEETVELDYQTICWSYLAQDEFGKVANEQTQCWDRVRDSEKLK